MGAPVSWKSRAQRNVTLSSMEAKYAAILEVCTKILFIKQILEFLGEEVEFPIFVHVDDVGAIFLAHNNGASMRTCHINVRYFVWEYV